MTQDVMDTEDITRSGRLRVHPCVLRSRSPKRQPLRKRAVRRSAPPALCPCAPRSGRLGGQCGGPVSPRSAPRPQASCVQTWSELQLPLPGWKGTFHAPPASSRLTEAQACPPRPVCNAAANPHSRIRLPSFIFFKERLERNFKKKKKERKTED